MKRALLIFLLALLCFSLFACGEDLTPEPPGGTVTPADPGSTETPDKPGGTELPESPETPDTPVPAVTYTVAWYDEAGNLLKTDTVKEGNIPSYTYVKNDTAEWKYTTLGWSTEKDGTPLASLPKVGTDVSYYACIKAEKQKYKITFVTGEGSTVEPRICEYGETLTVTEKSLREGYRFTGWCTDAAGKTEAVFPMTVKGNITLYAAFQEQINIKAFLNQLLSSYKADPWSYIPTSMRPGAAGTLLSSGDVPDYLTDTVRADMVSGGFGEQWKMVLDNLSQSEIFFQALSKIETVSGTVVAGFNNYFDKNPADSANYTFAGGDYHVRITYDAPVLSFILEYTKAGVTVQIAMTLHTDTNAKQVRIQLSDANALTYTMTDNSYTFAIKYLGVRRAYFHVERNTAGKVEGHINEYLTVSGKGIHSAADFYVTGDYVSVVGNKASGLIGFTGYINELYQTNTGKLIGYEVREELSKIVYNTLWFNLTDISGWNTLRYRAAEKDGENAAFLVDGKEFVNKKVGGLGAKMLSRRFDIEYRTQYFYVRNENGDGYDTVAVEVPMLFVQEEYLDSLSADVKAVNKSLTVSVTMPKVYLDKIRADYKTLIDEFQKNKDSITEEKIIEMIGDAPTI